MNQWTPPPSGNALANVVAVILRRQAAEAMASISRGRVPDLSRWTQVMADACRPILATIYAQGGQQAFRRILAHAPRHLLQTVAGRSRVRKSFHVRRWMKDEGAAGKNPVFDFVFDLFNPRIKTAVDDAVFQFCEATNATSIGMIEDALAALRRSLKNGLERGEATLNLNARVYRIFNDPYRAARIGQTETSRAVHTGQLMAAKESGVIKGKRWIASPDACPECLALNGKEVRLDMPFIVLPKGGPYAVVMIPPLHPHCLLGETPIIPLGAVGATKSHYRGPVVRIVLSSGDSFTCTPNHMLLTPHGFARAKALMKGDDVIHCPDRQGSLGSGPHDERKPIRIDEVVASLSKSSGMASVSVPVAAEYLHGDAAFCDGQIDVVSANRLLLNDFANANVIEYSQEFDFERRNIGQVSLLGNRLFGSMLNTSKVGSFGVAGMPLRDILGSIAVSLDGCVGRHRELFADALRRSSVTGQLSEMHIPKVDAFFEKAASYHGAGNAKRFGDGVDGLAIDVPLCDGFDINLDLWRPDLPTEFDISLDEPIFDGVPAHVARLRDTLHRLAGQVTTCKILDIQILHFDGPVYDVETENSLYIIGSGVVSSNCFCSWSEVYGTPQIQRDTDDVYDAPLRYRPRVLVSNPAGMPTRLAASMGDRQPTAYFR